MNTRLLISLRLVRNVLVAIFSAAYILPLSISADLTLSYLEQLGGKQTGTITDLFSSEALEELLTFALAKGFFNFACICLAVITVFWAFVIANKLWPIRVKPKDEQE